MTDHPDPDISDTERLGATWSHMVAAHLCHLSLKGAGKECEALYEFEAEHGRARNTVAALAALAASLVNAYAEVSEMPADAVIAGLVERAETQHDATTEIIRITKGDNQ